MRGRTLILFLVAVILAGGTAMLVRSWLAQQHAPPEATAAPMPIPQKSILVTRGQISRGHILKPENLAWQPWPEGHISPAYIQSEGKSIEKYSGWVARAPFGPDEPITEAKIVSPGSRGFLAAALQPGMRAVSVVVNKASDVSGFILPGDQVDILITHSIVPAGIEGEAHQIAETVLHDLRVLAIDQKLDSKGDEPLVAQTVTLEATPKQTEMIAVAAEMGKLWLSLRSLPSTPAELISDGSSNEDHNATFTFDSEVSSLMPKPFAKKDKPKIFTTTILHGIGKNETVETSEPASEVSSPPPVTPAQPPRPARTNSPI